ncbi:hypothetical protein [Sphingomonas sp. Leaf25]|uniref:hypothetical protein n=1 Tax=Sphingomonas sp. Leaf25 TaxID=1735692 RepID=UPI0006F31E13|nr:hypothetical protein [Sphingomonas sp. Leaf25]KQM98758.1 hypothetical protein ASE78_05895 [Sphingomonas sp. Leaf25]
MDDPTHIEHPFLVLAWIGAGALLFAGVEWVSLYKRMSRRMARGGGDGLDLETLRLAALFTGVGLIAVVVGFALEFGL